MWHFYSWVSLQWLAGGWMFQERTGTGRSIMQVPTGHSFYQQQAVRSKATSCRNLQFYFRWLSWFLGHPSPHTFLPKNRTIVLLTLKDHVQGCSSKKCLFPQIPFKSEPHGKLVPNFVRACSQRRPCRFVCGCMGCHREAATSLWSWNIPARHGRKCSGSRETYWQMTAGVVAAWVRIDHQQWEHTEKLDKIFRNRSSREKHEVKIFKPYKSVESSWILVWQMQAPISLGIPPSVKADFKTYLLSGEAKEILWMRFI